MHAWTQCTLSRAAQCFQLFNLTFLRLETTKTSNYYEIVVYYKSSLRGSCRCVPGDGRFLAVYPSSVASDLDGAPAFMASSASNLRCEQERWRKITFAVVKDYQKAAA